MTEIHFACSDRFRANGIFPSNAGYRVKMEQMLESANGLLLNIRNILEIYPHFRAYVEIEWILPLIRAADRSSVQK